MATTNKNWTTEELITAIVRRWTGSGATSKGRDEALEEAKFAWQEIVAMGDEVGDVGWIWMIAAVSLSGVVSGPVLQVPQVITLPGFHRGILVRAGDNNFAPKVYQFVGPREAHMTVTNKAQSGDAQRVWVDSYDPALDEYSLYFHPIPAVAAGSTFDMEIVYQKQGAEILDSPFASDNVLIPPMFREALIWGALTRLFSDSDTESKQQKSEQMYARAMERLMIHAYAQQQEPERVFCESEVTLQANQSPLNGDLWDGRHG